MTHVSPSELAAGAHDAFLAGRAREQERLRATLQATIAGRGGLVLVGGEAGIGKTTLVDWLTAEARRHGALVLEGHCYDLTQAPPYGPWREALAGAPGLGNDAAWQGRNHSK